MKLLRNIILFTAGISLSMKAVCAEAGPIQSKTSQSVYCTTLECWQKTDNAACPEHEKLSPSMQLRLALADGKEFGPDMLVKDKRGLSELRFEDLRWTPLMVSLCVRGSFGGVYLDAFNKTLDKVENRAAYVLFLKSKFTDDKAAEIILSSFKGYNEYKNDPKNIKKYDDWIDP